MSAPFMAAPASTCGAAAAPATAARGGFMAIDIGDSLRSVRASGLYRGSGREATMRIRALQHVSIRSRDLDRARDFYERLLGLPTLPRPELGFPGAWYGIGTSQLDLIAQEKMIAGSGPTE